MLRPATPADYPAIVAVHNRCWPEHIRAAQDFARFDSQAPTQRFVAEAAGVVVAHGFLREYPEYLEAEVAVLPEWRGQGLGKQLYTKLEAAFPNPRSKPVIAGVKESHPYALAFAQHRGFRESRRTHHHYLQLETFDPAPYQNLWNQLEAQGYSLISYQDLPHSDKELRFYTVFSQTELDVPRSVPYPVPSLENFRVQTLQRNFLPQAVFVAVYGDQYVGLSSTRGRTANTWHTRMTGVLPEHRGKGLALALKAKVAQAAKAEGILELHTNNDAHNVGMLAVNQKLGFVREPAQIEVKLEADTW